MDGQTVWRGHGGNSRSAVQLRTVWVQVYSTSEVVVVGDEVLRAPGWSAGFLHLHFSVAGGDQSLGED